MKTAALTVLSFALFAGLAPFPAMAQPADKSPAKPAASQPDTTKPEPAKESQPARVGDAYPLATCPITGGKLGSMGDPIVKLYDGVGGGREVRFCCKACPPKFEKDLAKSMATLDEAIIKDQAPLYPLKTSVVTGKDLPASPAKPYEFVYGNRLIRLGAESEKAGFLKDPRKHLAALDKAVVAAQGKDYPITKCPVSGDAFGGDMGEPVDMVIASRLVRLCCKGCKKDVEKDPAKFIAIVDEARKAGSKADKPAEHAAVYTCPMHPDVTSDKADTKCPKCGMKLVQKK